MKILDFFISLAVMAGITYLVRMLPLVFFKGKIENKFVRSFLHYIPYTVLAAMTFPQVLFETSNIYSALAGVVVAIVLAFFDRGLLTVAVGACFAVFVGELITFLVNKG